MKRVIYKPTAAVRRVAGERDGVLHFMQCIKAGGETFYWASVEECEVIPKNASDWEIRVRRLTLEIENRRAKERATP